MLTEGKPADAAKVLDAAEKDADARKLAWQDLPALTRGWMSLATGKFADAVKTAAAAAARGRKPR